MNVQEFHDFEPQHRNRRHVLHVDDDKRILRLVQHHLGKDGYEVTSLNDPRKAMAAITKEGFRVVILDIDMPNVDGLSLLRRIKARNGGIQVILYTGMVSLNTVLQSSAFGAETCLFKSLHDLSHLTQAVNQAYVKIDQWWELLDKWLESRKSLKNAMAEQS